MVLEQHVLNGRFTDLAQDDAQFARVLPGIARTARNAKVGIVVRPSLSQGNHVIKRDLSRCQLLAAQVAGGPIPSDDHRFVNGSYFATGFPCSAALLNQNTRLRVPLSPAPFGVNAEPIDSPSLIHRHAGSSLVGVLALLRPSDMISTLTSKQDVSMLRPVALSHKDDDIRMSAIPLACRCSCLFRISPISLSQVGNDARLTASTRLALHHSERSDGKILVAPCTDLHPDARLDLSRGIVCSHVGVVSTAPFAFFDVLTLPLFEQCLRSFRSVFSIHPMPALFARALKSASAGLGKRLNRKHSFASVTVFLGRRVHRLANVRAVFASFASRLRLAHFQLLRIQTRLAVAPAAALQFAVNGERRFVLRNTASQARFHPAIIPDTRQAEWT